MAEEQSSTQLTEEQLRKLQEIHVPVNFKGLFKAWKYVTHDKPFSVYQTVARKIEGRSKKIMFGKRALIGMPLGIILRNTSRAAHNLSDTHDSKFGYIGATAGVIAAIGAVVAAGVFAGPAIAAALGAGTLAAVGFGVASAAAGAVVLPRPVYTVATLATSSVGAAAVFAFSTLIAAPANLIVGYRRSKANLGAADQEKQLAADEAKFNSHSPAVKFQQRLKREVDNAIPQMAAENKLAVFQKLKNEFEPAAAQQTAQAAAPANKQASAKAAAPAQS